MNTINGKAARTPRTPATGGPEVAQWAGNVRNSARSLELGMKTLTSLLMPGGKAPGGLVSAASTAVGHGADLLTTLLAKRFDVTMTKADLGMLDVAQRALQRAGSRFAKVEKDIDAARVPPNAVKYPSTSFDFDDVDDAAAKLVAAATSSVKPLYADVYGTKLIARPGQRAADVVSDWRTASGGGVRNPLGNLESKVGSRRKTETARAELDALAKTAPRALAQVLADVAGHVGGDGMLIAGLYELKHPAEIKAFLAHMLEHPDKSASTSVEDARETAIGNVRFYANERMGAASGTEGSWNTALDELLDQAQAAAAAKDAAAQAADAEQRQARLDRFKSGGNAIVDTPPSGMVFDTRGLIRAHSAMNEAARPLQLITAAQLDELPTGTKLTSIAGQEVIKGVDAIDRDRQGGFLAFGFLQ